MDYRELMRMKILADTYEKMSDEDRRTFLQLTMQNNGLQDTLQRQGHQIEDIHEKVSKQTWLSDFSSNIAGNAVWDGAVWLVSRLLRKL